MTHGLCVNLFAKRKYDTNGDARCFDKTYPCACEMISGLHTNSSMIEIMMHVLCVNLCAKSKHHTNNDARVVLINRQTCISLPALLPPRPCRRILNLPRTTDLRAHCGPRTSELTAASRTASRTANHHGSQAEWTSDKRTSDHRAPRTIHHGVGGTCESSMCNQLESEPGMGNSNASAAASPCAGATASAPIPEDATEICDIGMSSSKSSSTAGTEVTS